MIRRLSPTALTLDIVGAVLLYLVLTSMSFIVALPIAGDGQITGWSLVGLAFASVMLCAAVAIGRLAPGLALGAAWVGAASQMASGLPPLPINFGILLVLYSTAAWGTRRVLWWGFASMLLGGLVAAAYIVIVGDAAFGSVTAWERLAVAALILAVCVLALGLAWVCGLLWRVARRARRTKVAQLRAEALAAEEQERVSIARDMHDIVAHSLAVVIAQANGARYAAVADPEVAADALETISQTARAALSDVRMLLTQLRHRQGDGPQPALADLEALFAQVRHAGIEPRITIDPIPAEEPPGAIQLAVYRILQEALTNAIRHGDGTVDVQLAWFADRVDLDVRNTVGGDQKSASGGHGLIGMRERAQLVGGSLQAERRGAQFVVHATLPIGAFE